MSFSSANGAAAAKSQGACPGFQPQQWRHSVCKNCFRSADRHTDRHTDWQSTPETEVEKSDNQTTEHGMDEDTTRPIIIANKKSELMLMRRATASV